AIESDGEHVPEALLKHFWIDALGHLVLTDHEMLGNDLAEIGALELLSGDLGKDDTETPREEKLPSMAMFSRREQSRVALEPLRDRHRVLPRLLEGTSLPLQSSQRHQVNGLGCNRVNRIELPVLHLYDQKPSARMQDDEVRMLVAAPDRHI